MEMSKVSATCGSRPMVANSVVPMPKPPSANAPIAAVVPLVRAGGVAVTVIAVALLVRCPASTLTATDG
nr:hypothetical protein GCM10017745_61270 [Saccharothrix mutabilis subsp. capreolus]